MTTIPILGITEAMVGQGLVDSLARLGRNTSGVSIFATEEQQASVSWMTGGTADRIAAERADTAVVAALTPVCVEKFLQNGDAQANLAVIKKIPSNWEQGEYVPEGRLG